MAVPNLEDLFEFGTSVMGSVVNESNNCISITTGDSIIGEVTGSSTQMWQQFGFASRPALAAPGLGSAQTINIVRANGNVAISGRDLRDANIYGHLGPGDTCVYGTGATGLGQARVICNGNDGSVTLSTTTDSMSGSGKANTESGDGCYLRVDTQGLTIMTPWGYIKLGQEGFSIKLANGSGLQMLNLPAALATMGTSQIKLFASTITLDSPTVMLGPSMSNGGTFGYFPVVGNLNPALPTPSPVIGVGVGAVTVPITGSSKVFVSL
jgi:hypothetical protein